MTPNSTHVQLIVASKTYQEWAAKLPVDASKVQRRLDGQRTTEPASLFFAALARLIVAPPHMPDVKQHVQTFIRSQGYQEWVAYRTARGAQPHKTDHNKVMRRLAGERTTEPSSNIAKGLARLLYQPVRSPTDPPDPDPSEPTWPPNSGFVHDVFEQDITFTRSLSSFSGLLRAEARQQRFMGIAIQLDHAYYVGANIEEYARLKAYFDREGHVAVGWSTYGQGEAISPYDEGRRHAELAKRHTPRGWIANGELWCESAEMWKTAAWIEGWLANGGAEIPLACSCLSSTTADWAREFDYKSWLAVPGSMIMPQVYGASHAGYTVHNCLETMKRNRVPKNRLGLTFDVIEGQGPFADYRTWPGWRQLWTGDDARSGTFAALAR